MGDPADPAFGIVTWNQEHPGPYAHWASVDYGDNAANVLIGGLVTRALAQTSSWDMQLLRSLLAEARTSGTYLSREAAVSVSELRSKGWRAYWNVTLMPNGASSDTGQVRACACVCVCECVCCTCPPHFSCRSYMSSW